MAWPKGKPRPRKVADVDAPQPPPKPRRQYRSVAELVAMMRDYLAVAGASNRGLFEDCKRDIFRMFCIDYNDVKALADLRPTGCSDRVYGEWAIRFERAFGKLR